MNLSLYTVSAFLIIDTDGHRVLAKYYHPKGHPNGESKKLTTLKEQRAYEKGLFQKTKKAGGDIILYDSHLAVYKHSLDLIFYIIGDPSENELMLHAALVAFSDAVHMLLRNQVEKRGVLENLDLVLLCLDETIDDGCVPLYYHPCAYIHCLRGPSSRCELVAESSWRRIRLQLPRESVGQKRTRRIL
ncbi:Longin-like domain-containing protein [Daedaleopsis nitida]|nr:Longin-like domain-containing protein [Daedaleopsis nitida]